MRSKARWRRRSPLWRKPSASIRNSPSNGCKRLLRIYRPCLKVLERRGWLRSECGETRRNHLGDWPPPEAAIGVLQSCVRFGEAARPGSTATMGAIRPLIWSWSNDTHPEQPIDEDYDPNLGIMHFDREHSPTFVFDLVERE